MPRFDVYQLGGLMVVDVQTDYLPTMATRLVIPLETLQNAPQRAPRLNPIVEVDGQRFVLIPQQMSSIPIQALRDKVGSLSGQSDDVTDAIQVLLTGF
jgi:toxin CcdB